MAHEVQEALPEVDEKLPAKQLVQEEDAAAEYCPERHAVHALNEPFGTYPAKQKLHADAPAIEYELLPQTVQNGLEDEAVYVPAAQLRQTARPDVE